MQNVRNDPLLDNKMFKRTLFSLFKTISLKTGTSTRTYKVLGPVLQKKSILPHK